MTTELPLHDASFSGIIIKGSSADLHFSSADGAQRVVSLYGIDAMQMSDFRQGNIVVLFEIDGVDLAFEAGDWERLYPSPHPSAAQEYHSKHDAFISRKRRSIEEGRLAIARMIPAYGADLIAVCEKVECGKADGS